MLLNKLTSSPLTSEVREVKNAKLTSTYLLKIWYVRPVVDTPQLLTSVVIGGQTSRSKIQKLSSLSFYNLFETLHLKTFSGSKA